MVGVRSRIGRNAACATRSSSAPTSSRPTPSAPPDRERGVPDLVFGDDCVIERAISDKDVPHRQQRHDRQPPGVAEDEGDNYVIRDGIVVIPRGTCCATAR